MKNFMDENFLLQTETAQKLYHEDVYKRQVVIHIVHANPVFRIRCFDNFHLGRINIYISTITSAIISHYTIAFGYFSIGGNNHFLTDKRQ